MSSISERLRARTRQVLPRDWQEGRKCPECGSDAKRPKCYYDMGGGCPRHDPDNYDESPYVTKPDVLCHEAADTIDELVEALEAANNALAQVTAFEMDARYIMGNTNFEIVKMAQGKVRTLLAKVKGEAK